MQIRKQESQWLAMGLCVAVMMTGTEHAKALTADPEGKRSVLFTVDTADPENHVPTADEAMRNPLEMGYFLMDLTELGAAAEKKGDAASALRYYRAMAKAVPDRSVAFSKQCTQYEALGQRVKALETCRQALGLGGVTVADHVHFVHVLLAGSAPLSKSEIADADAVISHIEQVKLDAPADGRVLAAELRAELGLRLTDLKRLRSGVGVLAKLAPSSPKTMTYGWALAIQERNFDDARKYLEVAKRAGLPKPALDRMVQGIAEAQAASPLSWLPRLHTTQSLPIVAALVLLMLGAGWAVTRHRTRLHRS